MTAVGLTFLYSDRCPRCGPALRDVAAWCLRENVRLLVRKPTPAELAVPGFGFPAVAAPGGLFGLPQTVLLVGDRPVVALTELLRRNPR